MARPRRRKSRIGERFAEPFISRAWHPDGTPFTDEDYRRAGLDVPSPEQKAAFAREDRAYLKGRGIGQ